MKHISFLLVSLALSQLSNGQTTIQNNGNLRLHGGANMSVFGDFVNNGTFSDNLGTLHLTGSTLQTLSGTSPFQVYNMTIDNTSDAALTTELQVINTLSLENGSLFTGDSLVLISDQNGTARISEIKNGSVVGDMTMQRYINTGATNWRFLTFAVSGQDLESFDDDFITSGFPGTDFPNWPTASNPWPSFYFYDESLGTNLDDGFYPPTSTSEVVGIGQGVWIWCGDTITGTQPFTIDVKGPTNQGDINLPVSYTNSANDLDEDGWNMVSNPYPCTIDWNATDWIKTNIDDAIYIWNPDNAQYASYVGGVGTNLGSNKIASSQAFWVHTNAASPLLTIRETCKIDEDQGFLRAGSYNPDMLRLRLDISSSNIWDETVIRFESGATDNYDIQFDARKFVSNDVNSPQLSSLINTSEYSINTLEPTDHLTSIDLKVVLKNAENCTLKATDVSGISHMACVLLEDLASGIFTNLKTDSIYTFYQTANSQIPRFKIHFSPKSIVTSNDVSCTGDQDGKAIAYFPRVNGASYLWTDSNGDTLQFNTLNSSDSLLNLKAGTYYVLGADPLGYCPANIDTVIITEPLPLIAGIHTVSPGCYSCCDGSISATLSGGVAPYTYLWNDPDQQTTATAADLCTGAYDLQIVDANNCNLTISSFLSSLTSISVSDVDSKVNIFPNPTEGLLILEASQEEISELNVFNQLGQNVTSNLNLTRIGENRYMINLFPISPGLYMVKTKTTTHKIYKR